MPIPRVLIHLAVVLSTIGSLKAGGVTVITHGFNSDVESWILPMAQRFTGRPDFPGNELTCYIIEIAGSDGAYPPLFSGGHHSDVHAWYHGTVELGATANDGTIDTVTLASPVQEKALRWQGTCIRENGQCLERASHNASDPRLLTFRPSTLPFPPIPG